MNRLDPLVRLGACGGWLMIGASIGHFFGGDICVYLGALVGLLFAVLVIK